MDCRIDCDIYIMYMKLDLFIKVLKKYRIFQNMFEHLLKKSIYINTEKKI